MNLLAECELDIEEHRSSYQKAARAFITIDSADLWADRYYSFQNYCEKRWGFQKSHVNRLMKAGKLLLTLDELESPVGELPPTERCIRPLMKIKAWHKEKDNTFTYDEDGTWRKRAKAWRDVVRSADGQAITEKDVEDIVFARYYKPRPDPKVAEKTLESQRKAIWKLINELGSVPLTPKQLIGNAFYTDLGGGAEQARDYINELFELIGNQS